MSDDGMQARINAAVNAIGKVADMVGKDTPSAVIAGVSLGLVIADRHPEAVKAARAAAAAEGDFDGEVVEAFADHVAGAMSDGDLAGSVLERRRRMS